MNFGSNQGNVKFYVRVSEKSVNFVFVLSQGVRKSFGKGNVSKQNYDGIDFCRFIATFISKGFVFSGLKIGL